MRIVTPVFLSLSLPLTVLWRGAATALLALAVLGPLGCFLELELREGTRISCEGAGAVCPDGYRCVTAIGLCVANENKDKALPALSGTATITPSVVGEGGEVQVRLVANEELLAVPVVRLRAGSFAGALVGAVDGDGYAFTYRVSGDEPEGQASVSAVLVDLAGNTTDELLLGTVALDFSPPVVTNAEPTGTIPAQNQQWTDNPALALALVVADTPAGVATMELAGDLLAPGEVPFNASPTVNLTAGDGPKVLTLVFADAVGNTSEPVTLAIQLDESIPANAILIDLPVTSGDLHLNADQLSIFFHSGGSLPADLESYVVSENQGASWASIGRDGRLVWSPLTQDARTELWLRERDLFGNTTPEAQQAVLVLVEDSMPPSKPGVGAHTLVDRYSSRAGLFLTTAAEDPGGGPVTYELLGGALTSFTPAGSSRWLELPGLTAADTSLFVIRAVDRAGNSSEAEYVLIADDPVAAGGAMGCIGAVCFFRRFDAARDGKGLEIESLTMTRRYVMNACTHLRPGYMRCGELAWNDVANYEHTDVLGRWVTWEQPGAGVFLYDLGIDELPNSDDDAGPFLLDANGRTPALGIYGVAFAGADNGVHFYSFGEDRLYGGSGADADSEGLLVATPQAATGQYARLACNGRQILWHAQDASAHLYDLGEDLLPGTADDGATVQVAAGDGALDGTDDRVLLDRNAVFVRQDRWIDFGVDGVFGTGDDVERSLAGVADLQGDKLIIADRLHDGSSAASTPVVNDVWSHPPASDLLLGGSLVFFGVTIPPISEPVPAMVRWLASPWRYAVAEKPEGPAPTGILVGSLACLPLEQPLRLRCFDLNEPGAVTLDVAGSAPLEIEADTDGRRIVYRQPDGDLALYDLGPDLLPATTDDFGPALVATGAGPYHAPRVDGPVVVWADLTGDADGFWYGPDLVSDIIALDLGADGRPGGGDDQSYAVTTSHKAFAPDVSGQRVVWLDVGTGADPDGLCPADIDPGSFNVYDDECLTGLRTALLGEAPTVLSDDTAYKGAVQLDGAQVAWAQLVDNGAGNFLAQVMVARIGEAPIQLTHGAESARYLALDGQRLAYFTRGTAALDAGADGLFATADDVVLLEPDGRSEVWRDTMPGPRFHWLSGDLALAEGALIDLTAAPDLYLPTDGARAIPDADPAGVESSVEIAADPWVRVHDLRLRLSLTHADVRELRVYLTSPSGGEALIYDGYAHEAAAGADLDRDFDLFDAPGLLDHYGEPLAGTWRLRVVDRTAGAGAGTLIAWSLWHRY